MTTVPIGATLVVIVLSPVFNRSRRVWTVLSVQINRLKTQQLWRTGAYSREYLMGFLSNKRRALSVLRSGANNWNRFPRYRIEMTILQFSAARLVCLQHKAVVPLQSLMSPHTCGAWALMLGLLVFFSLIEFLAWLPTRVSCLRPTQFLTKAVPFCPNMHKNLFGYRNLSVGRLRPSELGELFIGRISTNENWGRHGFTQNMIIWPSQISGQDMKD